MSYFNKKESKNKMTIRRKKILNNGESLSQSVFMTHYNTVLFDLCGKKHLQTGIFMTKGIQNILLIHQKNYRSINECIINQKMRLLLKYHMVYHTFFKC